MEEKQPPDHLVGAKTPQKGAKTSQKGAKTVQKGAKTQQKGARAKRAPLFLMFLHLPSGLAGGFPAFRAAISRVRIANLRARIPARWTDRPFDRQNDHLGIL